MFAIFILTTAFAIIAWIIGYAIGVNNQISHTDYLNRKYLEAVKKAQKANLKNKAVAEFWYNESERYKSLLEAHNEFLKKKEL